MRELTFIRHAKSDWNYELIKDVDRHLNERGYRDAYYTADWFVKNNKNIPDLILASTATRALSTALIFARTLNYNMANFELNKIIYESSSAILINLIKEQADSHNHIMIFGHNQSLTNVCNDLSEEMDFENVPTCGIVSLQFDLQHWADIKKQSGKLNYFQFPKDYRNKN